MARRGKFGKAALLMGAAAVAAGVLLKRDKVQALLSPGSGATEPAWEPSQPPGPSNYDAPGPPANTATPVPAPDPQILEEDGSVDEAAEEAAAAAEAANIGGPVSDYAGVQDPDIPADDAHRPLVEAGEGSSEGQEQAEAELAEAAQPADGMSDFERQIDEAIEEQASPTSGETLEPVRGVDDPASDAEMRAAETAEAPTEAYSTPPGPDAPADAPAPSGAEEASAYETYITPAVSPPSAEPEPEEPAGEVPFGEGTTAEQPPETASWQPPAPPASAPAAEDAAPAEDPASGTPAAEPEGSDPASPPQEQPQLPTDDDDDDGNDWRTWSGRAINP